MKILRFAKTLVRGLLSRYVGVRRVPSWQYAARKSQGYSNPLTVRRIHATHTTSNKSRESSLDKRIGHVLSAIQAIHLDRQPSMRLLDIGGGRGEYFFQLRQLLQCKLEYVVVETEEFISHLPPSLRNHQDLQYSSVFPGDRRFDLVLMSSVIQYVQDPWTLLSDACQVSDFVILNRLLLVPHHQRGVAIQKSGYLRNRVSYPMHLLSEFEFLGAMEQLGTIIKRWEAPEDTAVIRLRSIPNQGFLLRTST